MAYQAWNTGDTVSAAAFTYIADAVINVFATETARDAAITSPSDGMFAYTTTTPADTLSYYNGSAWVAVDLAGDITGITTAATLWRAAAFGVAAAMGLYLVATVAGAMTLVVVVTFGPLKPYVLFRRSRRRFEIHYRPGSGTLDALFGGLESVGGRIMAVATAERNGDRQTTIDVRGLDEVELTKVLAAIADREEVVSIDHALGSGD